MKRIITLSLFALVFFFNATVNSLTAQNSKWNRPYFDVNIGATWQTSDMKPYAGLGWGLGFGKWYLQDEKHFFDIGWHVRYLEGLNYGMDNKRSYGIQENLALNGFNSSPDYAGTSGYVFHNYRSHLNELSAELMLGANKLRERTHIILYVWGGVGISRVETKMNQLDGAGKMYNYSLVDSTSGPNAINQLDILYDNTYESAADGNSSVKWKFMPSAGVGLGYRFSRGFSMGVEFKTTWALNDVIDGQQWKEDNTIASGNDKYHYGGVFMRFVLGSSHSKTTTTGTTTHTDPTGYKNPTNPTNTNTTTYTNPTYPDNPTTTNTNPTTGPKPDVTITSPPYNNTVSPTVNTTVTAVVNHVSSAKDIIVYVNGGRVYNFNYNPQNKVVQINSNLVNGNNSFIVTANNPYGTDSKSTTVIYNPADAGKTTTTTGGGGGSGRFLAPVVTITSPNTNPFNTASPSVTVNATVINVASKSEITVMVNGRGAAFTYDMSSKLLQVSNNNLASGANTFVVTASNQGGTDTKSQTVIYSQPDVLVVKETPPVVTITQPIQPCQTSNSASTLVATVLNVSAKNNITVKHNGTMVNNFSYDLNSKQLVYNCTLVAGANTFNVTASNTGGTDTKSTVCTYTVPLKVNSGGGVSRPGGNGKPGGGNTSGGGTTGGGTVVDPDGNGGGSGGGTGLGGGGLGGIGIGSKPIITLTNPSILPYNTSVSPMTMTAVITDVSSASGVVVKVNGAQLGSISFANSQLSFSANLIAGNNTVDIIATNNIGTETKSFTILYNPGNKIITNGGRGN